MLFVYGPVCMSHTCYETRKQAWANRDYHLESPRIKRRPHAGSLSEFGLQNATGGIFKTLRYFFVYNRDNFLTNILDIVHYFSLCRYNLLYSVPEPRNKFPFLENNLKYFRMLFIVLLSPILADLVPMAETTAKTEMLSISPKIIKKGINIFRLLDFNPYFRRIYER